MFGATNILFNLADAWLPGAQASARHGLVARVGDDEAAAGWIHVLGGGLAGHVESEACPDIGIEPGQHLEGIRVRRGDHFEAQFHERGREGSRIRLSGREAKMRCLNPVVAERPTNVGT